MRTRHIEDMSTFGVRDDQGRFAAHTHSSPESALRGGTRVASGVSHESALRSDVALAPVNDLQRRAYLVNLTPEDQTSFDALAAAGGVGLNLRAIRRRAGYGFGGGRSARSSLARLTESGVVDVTGDGEYRMTALGEAFFERQVSDALSARKHLTVIDPGDS